ncbi:Cytochrome P450 [Fusarium oxysporum f. sp. vasinfectum]|nr:Cytochrome P450 [Fusarium oxysporum f. sp. vasinfectum]
MAQQMHLSASIGSTTRLSSSALELSKLPFGIDTLLAALRADRDQRTPDHVANRFAALGVYTFSLSILGTTNLVTAEPRNIQVILATQFNDFSMGAMRSTNLKTVLGRSIFAADGASWRTARDMMRPLFSRDNVHRLDLLEEHVQTLFRCIEKEKSPTIADGTWSMPVSLAALFQSLTLDSATELFLGQSTSTLQASLDGDDYHPGMEFHHAYAASTGSTARASCVHARILYMLLSTVLLPPQVWPKRRALPRHYMTFLMSSASGVAVATKRSWNKSLGFSPGDEIPRPH